jgi:hypothetical protein
MSETTRRRFLQDSLLVSASAALAAAGLPVGAAPRQPDAPRPPAGPNEAIRCAASGCAAGAWIT